MQMDLGPCEHAPEHLGLPAVELGRARTRRPGRPACARSARRRAKAPSAGTPSSQAAAMTMIPPGRTMRSAAAMPFTAW